MHDTTLKAESKEELKSLLMKVKEENEKACLKFIIPKTKIMAPRPITSWKIDGGKTETMTDFIFLGSKITADGDWRYEIKRCLLLGRKTITNLCSILKSRDITLLTKVHIVKTMAFPIVMHGCESWTAKKAECQRNDPLKVWCWRRLTFQSPINSKEIKPISPKRNQPWIFTERPNAETETPVLWPPDVKSRLIRKDPDTGKDWGQEEKKAMENGRVGWHHWLNGHESKQTLGDSKGQEAWHTTIHGVAKSQTWLSDWTVYYDGNVNWWNNFWNSLDGGASND